MLGSPASLYTFLNSLSQLRLGSGLPFHKWIKVSPNSPNFHSYVSIERTENQSFALPLSYRGISIVLQYLLRESDSNRRPLGYGPSELPTALSRYEILKLRRSNAAFIGTKASRGGRWRTRTSDLNIISVAL